MPVDKQGREIDADFFQPAQRDPYMQRIVSLDHGEEKGKITFDGYYRIDPKYYPIETILRIGDKYYHIEILSKQEGKDTSQYGEIEEPDGEILNVCFFPTSILTLTYNVLVEIESNAYFKHVLDRLENLDIERKLRKEKDDEEEWKRGQEEWKQQRETWQMKKHDKS
jgi:hypothetical protein